MEIKITSNDTVVTVSSYGAEAVSVVYNGYERLWQNENGGWNGHAPVLFPHCGNCKLTVDGTEYKRAAHGFARKSEFTLLNKAENSVEFVLEHNEHTKEFYPYDFSLAVKYTVCGNELTVAYTVTNPNDCDLPFSCGGHESFALASDVGEYCIQFEKKEHLIHHYHNDVGLLTGETHDYGVTDNFALPADFLTHGETLIFPNVKSRKVTLCDKQGNRLAESEFPDFENLLLWRPHGAKMICIEPWGNLPVNCSDFSEIAPFIVHPRKSKSIVRKIRYF